MLKSYHKKHESHNMKTLKSWSKKYQCIKILNTYQINEYNSIFLHIIVKNSNILYQYTNKYKNNNKKGYWYK